EVHEVCHYPNQNILSKKEWEMEKALLDRADLITVTTHALKQILSTPPYSIKTPIEVVPLAVKVDPLPQPPTAVLPLRLAYVGQLYAAQGLASLLSAIAKVPDVHLKIVGGTSNEIFHLTTLATELGLNQRVEFTGFVAPHRVAEHVKDVHAFAAPF